MTSQRFYSYMWLRSNQTPYYVGKGCGNRAFYKRSRRVAPPADAVRIIIFPMDSEELAFESEKALIALFGRKDIGTGILHNMTDGGDNPPRSKKGMFRPNGIRPSRENIARRVATWKAKGSRKGTHSSPRTEVKPGQTLRPSSYIHTDIHRHRMSEAAKRRWQSEDSKNYLSAVVAHYAAMKRGDFDNVWA